MNQSRQFCGNIQSQASSFRCSNVYRSRNPYVASPCGNNTNPDNDNIASQLFPFWGLWRTTNSPPLPTVFYPSIVQPQSLVDPNRQW